MYAFFSAGAREAEFAQLAAASSSLEGAGAAVTGMAMSMNSSLLFL